MALLPIFFIGGSWYLKNEKDELIGILQEEKDALIESGAGFIADIGDFVQNIEWEAIGKAVGSAASEVIKATTEVTSGIAKEIVPDLIESVERGYEVIREKMDGKEASMIGAFTVGFLVIMTFVYIFYEVRRGK